MQLPHAKILLLCEHAGVLMKYTEILNALGFFHVIPCSNFHEARRLIKMERQFEYLFYDGFRCVASRRGELLAFRENVANIVLFAEVSKTKRLIMSRWARSKGVSLLGILPRPIKIHQIQDVVCPP